MIIGTLQDYISARERMPKNCKRTLWQKIVKFFDLQCDSKSWQVFYLLTFSAAIYVVFLFLDLIHVYKTLGGQ